MKYTKMLGLLAVVAAALMAFAGSASATELTSPIGTKVVKGTKLEAKSIGAVSLTGTITITCQKVRGEGEVTNAGGPGTPVEGVPVLTTFEECGNHTITTLQKGTAKLESLGENTATAISNTTEVTVLLHSVFLGTVHCIYRTNNTHFGRAEGSEYAENTGARIKISAAVPRVETDGACGAHATMEGEVVLTSPEHLYID